MDVRRWLPWATGSVVGIWVWALLPVMACTGATAPDKPPTRSYEGAWFRVRYPAGFTVRPGLRSTSRGDRATYDSAFFVSPGKKVEFYVYAPQWNGDPTDVALDPKREVSAGKREQVVKKGTGGDRETICVRWVTVRAKDGSYTRSWVDMENETLNTRAVFGIKYRDLPSYRSRLRQFEAFKRSLEQFSD